MWKVHVVDLSKLFKICRVVKFLIRNLTRCKKVNSKSDETKKIWFKIWQYELFLIQNHAFYKYFFIQNHAFQEKFFSS